MATVHGYDPDGEELGLQEFLDLVFEPYGYALEHADNTLRTSGIGVDTWDPAIDLDKPVRDVHLDDEAVTHDDGTDEGHDGGDGPADDVDLPDPYGPPDYDPAEYPRPWP